MLSKAFAKASKRPMVGRLTEHALSLRCWLVRAGRIVKAVADESREQQSRTRMLQGGKILTPRVRRSVTFAYMASG